MQLHRQGYRPDIEGLRAVAILLVVAAHAKIPALAGGFVGVDVFFVLSGYLITGLLTREIRANNRLQLAVFYIRRLRRLLPALLLMLVVSSVLGWLLLSPLEQPDQAISAASASLWLSNIHFALARMDYFSPGSEANLFLHTWSLGVEEQFYLVWPLMLLALMHCRSDLSRLRIGLSVVFVLSLALSLCWTKSAPQLAFYMMPSRAWQFALGALVCLAPTAEASPQRWNAIGWIGLAMILAAALRLDRHVPYPGAWALLPSLGAAGVLASGQRAPTSGPGRLLAAHPMQSLGHVSYSWYLWHWPVLLLGATLVDTNNIWVRTALVMLSLLIAGASYRWVEQPIRQSGRLLLRPSMTLFAALALMLIAASLALRWHTAASLRTESPDQLRYLQVRSDLPAIYRMGCDDWYHSAQVRICTFGDISAPHTAIAVGDSVALQWFPALAQLFVKPGWRLLVITKSSCPMVAEPIFYARIGREYTECAQWRDNALRQIAAIKPDIVVMGSTFTYAYTQSQWIEGTRRVLASLSSNVRHIFLMRSTPTLSFDGPACLTPRSWLYSALSTQDHCASVAHTPQYDAVFSWLTAAAKPFSNTQLIDMTDAVCPNGVCSAELNGHIVFRDQQHMTASFVRSLEPALNKALNASTAAD